MNLTRKLSDLQQYASNIADGSVSMSDMMNTPSNIRSATKIWNDATNDCSTNATNARS